MERPELDPFSLVSGIAFAGLGVLFLLDGAGSLSVQPRWVWPILLIAIGVAGLLASRPKRSERDADF
jgi:fatty acid desaturase